MTRVALSIGANLGDSLEALQFAVDELATLGKIVAVSEVYHTDPVGGPEQPAYLNAVVVVETDRSPSDVLAVAHRAEQGKGRTREVRWGARTLDVDVLVYGDQTSDDPVLTLPHPRASQRAFVMIPWAAIDPDFRLPDGRTVADVRRLLDDDGVRPTGVHLRTVEP
ncbi:MAG: 2-amino-4-hydroxy-6-hydroxymethyldihydropteridine diphosphokinase [Candidatus Nanopelagicales bacterium]|jgi:2-amino-4-hydroxy-6-hydroxymethyldihydropteridine diphosphokinase|nr:2-amino-4-hydroxy-6-hydroxymethyldihydropteridine diphosphokinase [Candidatus Nanopelagicales bacterium]MCU0297095.1 2-amino-4-hydroxy-6-hydroxymethyldihydropteridine diphosphokinase [Candidatus Nanopelagicales bacterium]